MRKTWSFHVVVWQRTAKTCTKSYNARAQLLFCSVNHLFAEVAVAVLVCLSSLLRISGKKLTVSRGTSRIKRPLTRQKNRVRTSHFCPCKQSVPCFGGCVGTRVFSGLGAIVYGPKTRKKHGSVLVS